VSFYTTGRGQAVPGESAVSTAAPKIDGVSWCILVISERVGVVSDVSRSCCDGVVALRPSLRVEHLFILFVDVSCAQSDDTAPCCGAVDPKPKGTAGRVVDVR